MQPPSRSLSDVIRHALFTRFWKMDVAPSARIAPSAFIDKTNPRGVHIGNDCIVDHEAIVLAHDMTRGLRLHTRIAAGCQIGARAIIMPGVSLGEGCIVEPGSVVIRDLPAGSHVAGNPATAKV